MQLTGADLRLLRVFDAVVRHQGFAAAQAELNVSQSTISTQISALEERLGVTLCQRGRAGFRLTQHGRTVHQAATRFLNAAGEFVATASSIRGVVSGTLRIATVDSVVTDPSFRLPEAIGTLAHRYEAIRFEVAQASPQDLQTGVLEGRYHLGIGSFPHKVSGLDYQFLYDEHNSLYCSRSHELWNVDDCDLRPEDIVSHPAVGRSYWRDDHLNIRRFPNTTAMALGLEQQLMMILSGVFIGFLPDHAARQWVERGRMRAIQPHHFEYRCPFDIVLKKTSGISPIVKVTLSELLALYRKNGNVESDPASERLSGTSHR